MLANLTPMLHSNKVIYCAWGKDPFPYSSTTDYMDKKLGKCRQRLHARTGATGSKASWTLPESNWFHITGRRYRPWTRRCNSPSTTLEA